jgi:polar amino acid transport system substrate-binding protein
MWNKFRNVFILATVFVLVFSVSAWSSDIRQQLTQESTIEQVLKRGVLRVGFDTFVPWAMKDKNGQYIGFEIDVATRLAKDMGVKIEFVPTKWDGIIPALLTGKFDVIIGGMGITTERNKKVNFTIPYEYSGMSIMANKKLASGFKSLDDFNKPDVVVAAKLGTTAAASVKKFLPKAEARFFGDESQVVQEILNDRVHAVVASAPMPAQQVVKNPDKLFLPLDENFTKEPIGFVIRKGDVDTLNFFNNWITRVEAEGWLKERMHYWFGTMDWEGQLK